MPPPPPPPPPPAQATATPAATATATASSRLASLTTHLTMSSAAPKPAVTCHVLNTSTGRPAAGIPCTLSRFLKLDDGTASSSSFEVARAHTDEDGRVAQWETRQKGSAGRLLAVEEGVTYKIRFETWEYFAGDTFFPYVEVVFTVKDAAQHYHIPLLLAPYSYTTYRGS